MVGVTKGFATMAVLFRDAEGYLLGEVDCNVLQGRNIVFFVRSPELSSYRSDDEIGVSIQTDKVSFPLDYDPYGVPGSRCLVSHEERYTQEWLCRNIPNFYPNPIYGYHRQNSIKAAEIPLISPTPIRMDGNLALAGISTEVGVYNIRTLTSEEWYRDPVIQKWKRRPGTNELQARWDAAYSLFERRARDRSAEHAQKMAEAAERQARDKERRIRKQKDATSVQRIVRLQ